MEVYYLVIPYVFNTLGESLVEMGILKKKPKKKDIIIQELQKLFSNSPKLKKFSDLLKTKNHGNFRNELKRYKMKKRYVVRKK